MKSRVVCVFVSQKRMSYEEADTLQYYLESQSFCLSAKVYERNQDVAVCYEGSRQQLIALLQRFQYMKRFKYRIQCLHTLVEN